MTARVPLQAHLDLTPPRRRVTLRPPDPIRREGKEPVLDVVARREALVALSPTAVAVAAGAADISPVQALNKAEAARVLGTEEVKLRVPVRTAAAVLADPAAAEQALQKGADALKLDIEAFLGYTAWYTAPAPSCNGFYEVRQKSARGQENCLRMWFDAASRIWRRPDGKGGDVPHATLVMSHFWRGLRAPYPRYTYKVPGQRVFLKDAEPDAVGHHRV